MGVFFTALTGNALIACQVGIALIPILLGCFSAKKFNFIHGLIVTITLYCLFDGIIATLEKYMSTNTQVMNVIADIRIYCAYFDVIPTGLVSIFIDPVNGLFKSVKFMMDYSYLVYYMPIVIWIISRLVSGISRAKKLY